MSTNSEVPCQCHSTFAYISPIHDGHCCFRHERLTCHPGEVAQWERERDRRIGRAAR